MRCRSAAMNGECSADAILARYRGAAKTPHILARLGASCQPSQAYHIGQAYVEDGEHTNMIGVATHLYRERCQAVKS